MVLHSETANAQIVADSPKPSDHVRSVPLKIVSGPTDIETISVGRRIRELRRLERVYGRGRWRKKKGLAWVRLPDGTVAQAEVHWYQAHGIGRKELKIKRLL